MEKRVPVKATNFSLLSQAVGVDRPLHQEHPFYVDLTDVRSRYHKRDKLFKALDVHPKTFTLSANSLEAPRVVFLYGHGGSGKTTELFKYKDLLHREDGYFCIYCELDQGLDMNNFSVVDIIIYLSERLMEAIKGSGVTLFNGLETPLLEWGQVVERQIIDNDKLETGIEASAKAGISIPSLLELMTKLRTRFTASTETRQIARKIIKNNFSDFQRHFNAFVKAVRNTLQEEGKGQDILFIVDDLEKGGNPELRRRVVVDEADYFKQLDINMLLTLPVELIRYRQQLGNYARDIIPFPMIRLMDADGEERQEAKSTLYEFVTCRVDEALFSNTDLIFKLITFSGGSPRQLVKLLYSAYLNAEGEVLDEQAVDDAIRDQGNDANFLHKEEWNALRVLHQSNNEGSSGYGEGYTELDDVMQELLHKRIVYEYNEGSYRCVNPVIEASDIYKSQVVRKLAKQGIAPSQ